MNILRRTWDGLRGISHTSPRGPCPAILMYHRVAALDVDPWDLAVSPERFARQLDYVHQHRTPMPLDDFVAQLTRGDLASDAVAITFDDGYADNLHAALPRLAERNMPATLFLVTRHVDQPTPFWWDELARLVLCHAEGMDTEVAIGLQRLTLRWERADGPFRSWRASDPPRDGRGVAYLGAWRALRALPERDRCAAMARLRALLGPIDTTSDRTMTSSELDALVASGVFFIGAHSLTHVALSTIAPDAAAAEIRISKAECEALTRKPVTGFAYPYGDMNRTVRDLVATSGFAWACSTEVGTIQSSKYDRFALPRIAVGDWGEDRFAQALAVQ